MLPRFYAPDLDRALATVTLPFDEARHLTRVLRLGAGDEVAVFDGRGLEFRAVVEAAAKGTASLRLVEALPVPAAPAVRIVVVQGILKGHSMDEAIRDATMMGADAIVPVMTAHADVKATMVMRPETLDRWRRVALTSSKQCRRATLPDVYAPQALSVWLADAAVETQLIFVEPSASHPARSLMSIATVELPRRVAVLLGPEGGWSPEEIGAAVESGCIPVRLGPLTLRAESMAIAALAALLAVWSGRLST